MADGRISLAASSPGKMTILRDARADLCIAECIDLSYGRTTVGNPVGLYSCAGLGNTGAKDTGINWPLVNVTSM